MAKITIEINDTLDERVQQAIELVKEELASYADENGKDEFPDIGTLDYSGAVHEAVDGAVPIYTKEIEDTWYLHKDKLIEAYENAGVGENPMENNGMAAIYYYIQEQVYEWYADNAEECWNVIAQRAGE